MNSVRLVEQDFAIGALLTEDIYYNRFDEEILIPKNTHILVDIENSIALIGDDHVLIESNEYKVFSC